VVKDEKTGKILELHCSYDPATRSGSVPDGRKVKGTLNWLSVPHAIPAEIRLYDHLFTSPYPSEVPEGQDFTANLNPNSLEIVKGFVEPSLKDSQIGMRCQFLRHGYFCVDSKYSTPGNPVFNRTVSLRDTWAKIQRNLPK
jgi:glutaminyl-tRNA synthetase